MLAPLATDRVRAPCRRAPRRHDAGFTFIEVTIATVILAVAALVAFPTMLSFFELSDSARDENVATHDLMAATEDILSTPFASVTTSYPDGQAVAKYDALHLPKEQIVVSYENPAADPLLVTITATWCDSKGRPRQETYRCARTR